MADFPNAGLIDFSNIGKGIDQQMGDAPLLGPDAVATVSGMTSLINRGDIDGALELLQQRASRLENSGDIQGAATTRQWEDAIRKNPKSALDLGNHILNSRPAHSVGESPESASTLQTVQSDR